MSAGGLHPKLAKGLCHKQEKNSDIPTTNCSCRRLINAYCAKKHCQPPTQLLRFIKCLHAADPNACQLSASPLPPATPMRLAFPPQQPATTHPTVTELWTHVWTAPQLVAQPCALHTTWESIPHAHPHASRPPIMHQWQPGPNLAVTRHSLAVRV